MQNRFKLIKLKKFYWYKNLNYETKKILFVLIIIGLYKVTWTPAISSSSAYMT